MKSEDINARLDRLERLLLLSAKNVFNTEEVALVLGITPCRVRHLVADRSIPHYKQGQRNYFKRDEIEAWQTQHKVSTYEELNQQASSYINNNTHTK